MEKITLYNICAEQLRINEMLEESGGEVTPEIEEALVLNEENFSIKVDGYLQSIAKYSDAEELIANEIKRLSALKKTAANIKENLKKRLANGMEIMGYDKLDLGLHKLSFRSSTAVNITDECLIPAEYIIVETKVDKVKIKDALKGGAMIAGAELVNNKSLQIR